MQILPVNFEKRKLQEQKINMHTEAINARNAIMELSENRNDKLKTAVESYKFISAFRKTSPEEKKKICLETFDGTDFAHDLLPQKQQRYEVMSSLKGDDDSVRIFAHQLLGTRNFRPLKPEETEFLIREQKDDERLVKDIINYEPCNIGYCSPEVQQIALDSACHDANLHHKVETSIENARNKKISLYV